MLDNPEWLTMGETVLQKRMRIDLSSFNIGIYC